jgi:hypothetical protein
LAKDTMNSVDLNAYVDVISTAMIPVLGGNVIAQARQTFAKS